MNIQLTISLLASDRMATLGKCLESVSPLLRELNSELIVVATGRDPAVTELVRQYSARIIPFTWCDDFSKARNTGLTEAKGEWFLYLDDDEWFEDVSEIVDFFKSGEYRKYQSATYIQRNYHDWSGNAYTDAPVGRMCRLSPETQFIYPVHECLSPFMDPQKRLKSYVHHYGYVEKAVQKSERNLPLLLKRMEEEPSAHACMQLVQEYQNRNENEPALKYCRQGLEMAEKEQRIHMHELWLQVNFPILLASLGRKEEALTEGEKLLCSPRVLEVGEAHIHGILAEICWELNEYKKGLEHSYGFHRTMKYLERHPDKAERQVGGDITYDTAKEHVVTVGVAGLLFASALNETGKIKEILTWLPWENERTIRAQYGNLESWKCGHSEQKDVILEGYYFLKSGNGYVNLQKALYAEKMLKKEEAEEYFRKCAGNCPEDYMYQLAELAERNDFSLNPLLEKIAAETWDACAIAITERTDKKSMPERLQRFGRLTADYPLFLGRLEQHFLEKQLLDGACETERLLELLGRYCNIVYREAEVVYKEEIVANPDYYALPYQIKFALFIRQVLDNFERNCYAESIPLLKKAIRAYPQMSVAVGRLSEYLEKKMKEPQQPVSEEFAALGRQVKQMLLGLMENGQWQEAYGVAEQLTSLLPGDLEILKLKQEIAGHL